MRLSDFQALANRLSMQRGSVRTYPTGDGRHRSRGVRWRTMRRPRSAVKLKSGELLFNLEWSGLQRSFDWPARVRSTRRATGSCAPHLARRLDRQARRAGAARGAAPPHGDHHRGRPRALGPRGELRAPRRATRRPTARGGASRRPVRSTLGAGVPRPPDAPSAGSSATPATRPWRRSWTRSPRWPSRSGCGW